MCVLFEEISFDYHGVILQAQPTPDAYSLEICRNLPVYKKQALGTQVEPLFQMAPAPAHVQHRENGPENLIYVDPWTLAGNKHAIDDQSLTTGTNNWYQNSGTTSTGHPNLIGQNVGTNELHVLGHQGTNAFVQHNGHRIASYSMRNDIMTGGLQGADNATAAYPLRSDNLTGYGGMTHGTAAACPKDNYPMTWNASEANNIAHPSTNIYIPSGVNVYETRKDHVNKNVPIADPMSSFYFDNIQRRADHMTVPNPLRCDQLARTRMDNVAGTAYPAKNAHVTGNTVVAQPTAQNAAQVMVVNLQSNDTLAESAASLSGRISSRAQDVAGTTPNVATSAACTQKEVHAKIYVTDHATQSHAESAANPKVSMVNSYQQKQHFLIPKQPAKTKQTEKTKGKEKSPKFGANTKFGFLESTRVDDESRTPADNLNEALLEVTNLDQHWGRVDTAEHTTPRMERRKDSLEEGFEGDEKATTSGISMFLLTVYKL